MAPIASFTSIVRVAMSSIPVLDTAPFTRGAESFTSFALTIRRTAVMAPIASLTVFSWIAAMIAPALRTACIATAGKAVSALVATTAFISETPMPHLKATVTFIPMACTRKLRAAFKFIPFVPISGLGLAVTFITTACIHNLGSVVAAVISEAPIPETRSAAFIFEVVIVGMRLAAIFMRITRIPDLIVGATFILEGPIPDLGYAFIFISGAPVREPRATVDFRPNVHITCVTFIRATCIHVLKSAATFISEVPIPDVGSFFAMACIPCLWSAVAFIFGAQLPDLRAAITFSPNNPITGVRLAAIFVRITFILNPRSAVTLLMTSIHNLRPAVTFILDAPILELRAAVAFDSDLLITGIGLPVAFIWITCIPDFR
mmetsp:Transcript_16957/g.36650  ORF Transcript_16957/g.36650 Transcript_16957/m.36650 type:complete len:375 (-) Transcript_16957:577-1701(-)